MQIIVCRQLFLLPPCNETKNETCCSKSKPGIIKRPLRVMKLTAILLLAAYLQVSANGVTHKISLSVSNAPLGKVFKEIQKQTGYSFLYTSQLLAGKPTVSIAIKRASIKEVLDLVLKDQLLDYEICGSTIVISPKLNAGLPNLVRKKKNGVAENGKLADGATITIKSTDKGTTINLDGEFVLVRVNKNSVLLMASVVFGEQKKLVGNKKWTTIRRLAIIKNLDDWRLIGYENTSHPLSILHGRMPGVKIVLLTNLIKTSTIIWVQGRNCIDPGAAAPKKGV
jgi:hypothetical protein